MSKQYEAHWKVESDSSAGKFYTVSQNFDGSYECSCRGWCTHTPRRDCRHILYVKSGLGIVYDPCARAVTLANAREQRKAGVS